MERPDSPKKMSSTLWITLNKFLAFKDRYKIYGVTGPGTSSMQWGNT